MSLRTGVAWTVKLLIAGAFLYAGVSKAIHPGQMQIEIERYRLVSAWVAWASAAYLPYLEIIAALALLHPRTSAAGRLLLGVLLLVFAAALASAWARGLDIACGCFGTTIGAKPNYAWWIGRDLVLLAFLGWLHRTERTGR